MTNQKPTRNALKIQLSIRGYNQNNIANNFDLDKQDLVQAFCEEFWDKIPVNISNVFDSILAMPITDHDNHIPFTADQLKIGLSDRGLTQADVARYLKIERTAVYAVIKGVYKSARIAAELKRIMAYPPGEPIEGYSAVELHKRKKIRIKK